MIQIFGSAGEFDINAMERAAFQRGDTLLATLLGRIVDAEDDADEERKILEEERDEYQNGLMRATEALDDVHEQLMNELDALPAKLTKAELFEFTVRLQKIADFAIEAYKRERL